MPANTITITEEQRNALNKLWFVYGNFGKKCTDLNHRYIQGLLEHGEDREDVYRAYMREQPDENIAFWTHGALTDECLIEVKKILNSQ